ncbi:MAG: glycosyltransferase family 25 protein [Desulfosporosinus sp.]|nr:glycosyltransferase family 25 protein [Desulfosporosinus sp.]
MLNKEKKMTLFPPVNWITLDLESTRAKQFVANCTRLGIKHKPFVAERGDTFNLAVSPAMTEYLSKAQLGCLSSHMEMLKRTASVDIDTEWAMICEDDADLSWIDYWQFTWEQFASTIPADVGIVVLHVHPKIGLDNFKLGHFFSSSPGSVVTVVPQSGMTTYSCVALVVRPVVAKSLMRRYYNNEQQKWVGLPPFPSDVLYDYWDREGFVKIDTAPLIGEIGLLDSSIIGSSGKVVLRARRATGDAMLKALKDPRHHTTTFQNSVEMAKSLGVEFEKELLVLLGVTALIGTFVVLNK